MRTASDGREALQILQKQATIDCVILDILMPGMSGAECFDTVRGEHPNLPVIIYSGYGGSGGRSSEDFLQAGAVAVLG